MKKMRSIVIRSFIYDLILGMILISQLAFGADFTSDYCVAIRGNGELVPAHWSALARMVEELGMPKGVAGGSSGSISAFLLESVGLNRQINSNENIEERRRQQSLMLKSMPQYLRVLAEYSRVGSGFDYMNQLRDQDSQLSQGLRQELISLREMSTLRQEDKTRIKGIRDALGKYVNLFNPEIWQGLRDHPIFFMNAALTSIQVFGQFDAQSDKELFFRPGLIDFKYFSLIIGEMADFYAGNVSDEVASGLSKFLADCSQSGYQRYWGDISSSCRGQFEQVAKVYISSPRDQYQNRRIFDDVGDGPLMSMAMTAVIRGPGKSRYLELKQQFQNAISANNYGDFSIDFSTDLGFGYWGRPEVLEKVSLGLDSYAHHGDLKSEKFVSLGRANWFEVLSLSPAEPGLANIQAMVQNSNRELVLGERDKDVLTRWQNLAYRSDFVSAGGWSDLHPTLALRAAGCKNVVYLTRQGGETVFGQQVFIRLTGAQNEIPFWKQLGDSEWRFGASVSNTLAENSPWDRLYNLKNLQSSFSRSVREADAVYCTAWDTFKIKKGEMGALTREAYEAPVFLRPGAPLSLGVNKLGSGHGSQMDFSGCQTNHF